MNKEEWGGRLEFLMACISNSVGLGNIWRFPFTALENGGGAFLIPYIIILFLVGKPFYYLEGILGQFTSQSCTKTWNMSPAMKGISNEMENKKIMNIVNYVGKIKQKLKEKFVKRYLLLVNFAIFCFI